MTTHRERLLAVLRYETYDRLPVLHFGFLPDTLEKWQAEGHITDEERRSYGDGNATDRALCTRLGFDFNYYTVLHCNAGMRPPLETKVIAEFPDGSRHVQTGNGAVRVEKPGTKSIPSEVDHLLKDRASWEEIFKPRLQPSPERLEGLRVPQDDGTALPCPGEGLVGLKTGARDVPLGLHAGSLYGSIRNMVGIEDLCYMQVDDHGLFVEIIDTVAEVCYQNVKGILATGATFDFLHFWEDIAFKNGPLVNPAVFREFVGPHYARITALGREYGLDICSLDCDGCIDSLVPVWMENGVNTMFPIEVGTWKADIRPWRERFGRDLRGVGGMDKKVFATDRAGVDAEIERLRTLVELGGYIPCPDHRIAEDAEWDLVRYYCDRMHEVFS